MKSASIISIVVFAAQFGSVQAQESGRQLPPRFDVDEYCHKVARVTGSYSATIDRSCFEMEQTAYNGLKAIWSTVPLAARQNCERIATVTGSGSYSILQSCIQMEIDAMQSNKDRKFTY